MVQYLYAAYSLDPESASLEERKKVRTWQHQILEIAREEMGHLVTVQNLLRLVGGPLNFGRQDYPFQSDFYPFPFELEPLSIASLAKYIVAEMPEKPSIPEIEEIKILATKGNAGRAVNRVGKLYEAIIDLFGKLDDADFQAGSVAYQADFDTWGRDYARAPRGTSESPKRGVAELIVRPVHSRTTALAALRAVAEQGEGNQANESEFSHFQRFVDIFRHFKSGSVGFVRDVARNPVTMGVTLEPDDEPVAPITNEKSLLWAQLFNTRYRLLLSLLAHALHAESPITSSGTPSPRGRLIAGAFGEMYQLRALAGIIVRQPIDDSGSGLLCGPPFELPYSLAVSDLPSGRWKAHRDILIGSDLIIEQLRSYGVGETKYLDALQFQNKTFLEQIAPILRTLDLPAGIA
jgi:ferritin-like protein